MKNSQREQRHTKYKSDSVRDGEAEQVVVGGRVHVWVPYDDDAGG